MSLLASRLLRSTANDPGVQGAPRGKETSFQQGPPRQPGENPCV